MIPLLHVVNLLFRFAFEIFKITHVSQEDDLCVRNYIVCKQIDSVALVVITVLFVVCGGGGVLLLRYFMFEHMVLNRAAPDKHFSCSSTNF